MTAREARALRAAGLALAMGSALGVSLGGCASPMLAPPPQAQAQTQTQGQGQSQAVTRALQAQRLPPPSPAPATLPGASEFKAAIDGYLRGPTPAVTPPSRSAP